jgi:hypothetical protein
VHKVTLFCVGIFLKIEDCEGVLYARSSCLGQYGKYMYSSYGRVSDMTSSWVDEQDLILSKNGIIFLFAISS